jgi:hypothetical protein
MKRARHRPRSDLVALRDAWPGGQEDRELHAALEEARVNTRDSGRYGRCNHDWP